MDSARKRTKYTTNHKTITKSFPFKVTQYSKVNTITIIKTTVGSCDVPLEDDILGEHNVLKYFHMSCDTIHTLKCCTQNRQKSNKRITNIRLTPSSESVSGSISSFLITSEYPDFSQKAYPSPMK